MARMKDRKTKSNRVTIPGMSGVEGRITVAEGEYLVKVAEVTQEEGAAAPYLKWKFEIQGKVHNGAPLFYNTSLSTQALWNLRGLLEALQFEVPDDDLDVDPEEFVDLTLMVNVEHDTYEGKKQAKIVDFWAASPSAKSAPADDEDEEDEDEKPAAKKGRKAKGAPVEDDDEEEDEKPAPKSRGKAAPVEDEEVEEKSPRNSRRREKRAEKKAKPKLAQDDLVEMKQDELEDVAERYGFDIDFSELPTLRKMRNAVIGAAEEAGVLEE